MKKCMILFTYLFAVCLWGNIDISTLLERTDLSQLREIRSAQLYDISGNNSNDIIVHGVNHSGNDVFLKLTDNSVYNIMELNKSVQLFRIFSKGSNSYILTVVRDECTVGGRTYHGTFSVNLYDLETSRFLSTFQYSEPDSEGNLTYYSIKNIIFKEESDLIYIPFIYDVLKNDGTAESHGRTLLLKLDDNILSALRYSVTYGNQLVFTEDERCYSLNIDKEIDYNSGKFENVVTTVYEIDPVSLNTLSTVYETDEEINYAELHPFGNALLLNTHSDVHKGILIDPETTLIDLELRNDDFHDYTTINVSGVNKILGYSDTEFCIIDERTSFKLFKDTFSSDFLIFDSNYNTLICEWKDNTLTYLNLNNSDFLPPFITSTDSLSFPVQGINNSESEQVFSLYNNTNHTLLISEITAPDGYTLGEGGFQRRAIINDIVVPPASFSDIHVYFNPDFEGVYQNNINICTDLNGLSSGSIHVSGSCVEGVVTEVSILEDTEWSSDTVYVKGDLAIEEDVELIITAGTTIIMAPHSELFVYGSLTVKGTDTDPVEFTSSEGYWNGIRFSAKNNSVSKLDNCTISNILSIGESNIVIKNGSAVELNNCKITDNTVYTLEEGRQERRSSVLLVEDSQLNIYSGSIINNRQIGAQTDFSGILLTEDSDIVLDNSVFYENDCTDNALRLYKTSMNIINSNMIDQRINSDNSDIKAINTIMYSENYSSPIIIENESNVSIINCLLNKDASDYIRNQEMIYTESVIFGKPYFVNSSDLSFKLSGKSPCIDGGTDIISDYSFPFLDIDSDRRILDGDNDSKAVIDIGVNEYLNTGDDSTAPDKSTISLINCYPNPFNPSTQLSFSLDTEMKVNITIYNIKGQAVKTLVNDHMNAGFHKIEWDGQNDSEKQVSSGVYFCRMTSPVGSQTMKMVLMK